MKKSVIASWASGALFGAGLVISGMTNPANIKAFLDVTGDFDPSLALVMAGAVLVYAIAIRLPRRDAANGPISVSTGTRRVDLPLVVGAGLFGVGWGLSGYCPGPSIVALGFGGAGVVVFVVASLAGILLSDVARTALGHGSPRTTAQVEQGEVAKAS
jgi:uncharacterized membrane protein YedE/YeeE